MAADRGAPLADLRVDGGAARNDALLQFQADLLGVPVERPRVTETTAWGAAALAGLAVGVWDGLDELAAIREVDRRFEPSMDAAEARGPASRLAPRGRAREGLGDARLTPPACPPRSPSCARLWTAYSPGVAGTPAAWKRSHVRTRSPLAPRTEDPGRRGDSKRRSARGR